MAIQGTQVPIYTNTHCFCIFLIFQFFLFLFLWKTNKAKLKTTKTKTWKRNTQSIKLDWLKKRKQDKQVVHKQKGKREKKWLNHFEPFSFHILEEPFFCMNLCSWGEGEELKPFKFERIIKALIKSPRGAREDGNWFWFPDEIILLLCWVANHL